MELSKLIRLDELDWLPLNTGYKRKNIQRKYFEFCIVLNPL